MASELRVNKINSRTGFGTITVSETGQDLVGITTIENLTAENTLVGAAASFTGNVQVGGVLTYEDVTNIDSVGLITCLLYTSPSPRDLSTSRMPSSA